MEAATFRGTERGPTAPETAVAPAAPSFTIANPGPLGLAAFALTQKAGDFVNSTDHTRAAVDDVTNSGLLRGVQILNLPGTLCLAFSLVLLSLNAMRAGLLTRFMGVLGMICGAALVLLPQNPVVVFWLLALAVLFAHRWPQGMPPAWETGRAEPWPSTTELAEQRAAARGKAPARAPEPEEPSESSESGLTPHPTSKKRKRKRRH